MPQSRPRARATAAVPRGRTPCAATARTTWWTATSCDAIVEQAAVGPTTSSWRSARPTACSRGPCSSARAWCTRSRSTAAGCRGSRGWRRRSPRLVLHAGDALKADLAALDPPPTALVANLAYNIAIPLIMTTIAELPSVRRWAVMVQKELGERLFATPSTKAYSAVSVLAQLACRHGEVAAGARLRVPAAPARGVELRDVRAARARRRGRRRRREYAESLAPRAAGLRAAPQGARQLARRRRPRAASR